MRETLQVLLVISLLATAGCMISTQEGERTHVNAPPPEEITFHFDTGFNKALLFLRSAVLLSLALWFFGMVRKDATGPLPLLLALASLGAAGWMFFDGWTRTHDYRIEVRSERLRISLPSETERDIPWTAIEGIEVEGMARDVSFGDGKGQALKWASSWEDLTVFLQGGQLFEIDLRPLSVEQRGTFWRAIVSKAQLEGGIRVEPRG